MKDSFDREIDYMRISVTEKCNLSCFYCMPETQDFHSALTDEEIISIVTQAVKEGIKKFRITGGEPLVRKGIFDLLKRIKKVKGVKELSITTNGVLLLGNVKKLVKSGVDRINLSLDSLHTEDYQTITKSTKVFDFDSLIQEIIFQNDVPLKINVVLLKGINDNQIEDYIDLADKYHLNIRFIELMDIGELDFDYQKYYISKDEIIQKIPHITKVSERENTVYYSVMGKNGIIGFINPVSKKFCGNCNRIRLTADGHIRPCLHNDTEYKIANENEIEIQEMIRFAILNKPKEHELDQQDGKRSTKTMNRIGG